MELDLLALLVGEEILGALYVIRLWYNLLHNVIGYYNIMHISYHIISYHIMVYYIMVCIILGAFLGELPRGLRAIIIHF